MASPPGSADRRGAEDGPRIVGGRVVGADREAATVAQQYDAQYEQQRHRHAERAPQTRAEKTKFLVNLVACVSQILDETWIAARCAPNPIISGEDALGANFLLQNLARAALRGQKASERAVKRVKRIGEQELYGRSIAIRRAVVKSQAKCR